jgi:SecD/SecF fusion protein
MNKKTKWQLTLIITVLLLTLYNILPTLIFYSKPLDLPISSKDSDGVIQDVISRVNSLQDESLDWIKSFNKSLRIQEKNIKVIPKNPRLIRVEFQDSKDAETFRKVLPRSGGLISFYPSTLNLAENEIDPYTMEEISSNVVIVQRKIPIQFEKQEKEKYFSYTPIRNENGSLTTEAWSIYEDRILNLGLVLAGTNENSSLLELAISTPSYQAADLLYLLAENLVSLEKTLDGYPQIAKNFFASYTKGLTNTKEKIEALIVKFEELKSNIQKEKIALKEANQNDLNKDEIELLEQKETKLLKAINVTKKNKLALSSESETWTKDSLRVYISKAIAQNQNFSFDLEIPGNSVFEKIKFDQKNAQISLILRKDLLHLKNRLEKDSKEVLRFNALSSLIYDEVAKISRDADEVLKPEALEFTVNFDELQDVTCFIKLNLNELAKAEHENAKEILLNLWHPTSQDLNSEAYPVYDYKDFQSLPPSQKNLSLVVYSPMLSSSTPLKGFKENSIYVIAKDLGRIVRKFKNDRGSEEAIRVKNDFEQLATLLKSAGFAAYPGTTYPLGQEFANDYIFELKDFHLPLIMATRENFRLKGSKQYATLELSNLRDRILKTNQIETKMHEDLLKWQEEYQKCKVDPSMRTRFDVPQPTRNVLVDNFIISFKKYFRGDDRKILKWGLDLSGGKSVQIALRDSNNKIVTKESDLKQAMNELFARVNKMGVSDVNIRSEGTNITLDFPGSKDISASELVKASSMTFNIVNEKFSPDNQSKNSNEVNRFLQNVWNEAVVTNKKDVESINMIAWSHLYGDSLDETNSAPKTDSAKYLYEQGFRLANPSNPEISSNFNDVDSKIALYRGDSFAEWHGQTHPLLIVFKNNALEGSNLENVHSGYDPAKGNFLSFEVRNTQISTDGIKTHPRLNLNAWTSIFSKDKILSTPYENFAKGRGWRMAVILNGYVVSAPNLESALKDSGMITGHFTQREITSLVSDLKAGSLSFKPEILSEKTISPDLGMKERVQGIISTVVALIGVIAIMVSYYKFGGIVASIAVIINLFIMWGALQNIGASITLPGLAGIILTVGMAVDANVLVFERIREEFKKTGKIINSIQVGYQKAYSAIIDSNVTTIIAALILLNFDSGPVKGFAVTLIIGIVSSMFTALFMTRYFFSEWVKNPKNKELKMANLIEVKNINFIKHSKPFMIVSILVLVIGSLALAKNKDQIMGMDFTGGFAVNVELSGNQVNSEFLKSSLLKAPNVSPSDIQIREFGNNQFRISLAKSMTLKGKPFYEMPLETSVEYPTFAYEKNPKLVWLVSALEKSNISLSKSSLETIDQNFRSISGQMSDTMRNNALIGIGLACLAILVYITLRFEFAYAVSATFGLVFDLFITLAILGILNMCGVNIQIDLNIVAALMTIIGYSLNDTIIVFDRVREELKHLRHLSFKQVVNHSINATLSRTLLTSGTTLVVLVALVALGGSSLLGFSLIMAIGVVVGTLSTLFISSTLLIALQKKEIGKNRNQENDLSTNGAH